jgi:hypothetical protein
MTSDSMNLPGLKFLRDVSFFNYAYEGLAQNELVGRRLEDFPVSDTREEWRIGSNKWGPGHDAIPRDFEVHLKLIP